MGEIPRHIIERGAHAAWPDYDNHSPEIRRLQRILTKRVIAAVTDDLRAGAWEHGFQTGLNYGITLTEAAVNHTARPTRPSNPYK